MVFSVILLYLLVLVLLGYFTLLERKLLGYGQTRNGPNNAVVGGLFQPLLDGFNLFINSLGCHWGGVFITTYFFGVLGLSAILCLWWLLAGILSVWGVTGAFALLLLLSSLGGLVYYIVGFETCGAYSVYGSVRSLAMVLTYEGPLFFALMGLFALGASIGSSSGRGLSGVCLVLLFVLAVSVVIESSRTPVDFVEGESELVSGLVTELGGLSFSLLFLLEYGGMGFYSCLWCLIACNGGVFSYGLVSLGGVILMLLLNWLRISLPRSRYDLVIEWGWKYLLVVVFGAVLVSFSFVVL